MAKIIKRDTPEAGQVQPLKDKPIAAPKTRRKTDIPVVPAHFRPFGAGQPGIDFIEAPEEKSGEIIYVDFVARKRVSA